MKYLALALSKHQINLNMISPALLANRDDLKEVISNNLSKLDLELRVTEYSDIVKKIIFLSSGVKSLRGQELPLDYALSDVSSYWAIAKVLGQFRNTEDPIDGL